MNGMSIDAQTELLLRKSDQDRVCLNYPLPSENFGFHTQQAIEKLLKALIAAKGNVFPFIHSLVTLRSQLVDTGEVLPMLPCSFAEIQPYAVLLRYDDGRELTEDDRQRFIDTVDILRAFVLKRVAALSA